LERAPRGGSGVLVAAAGAAALVLVAIGLAVVFSGARGLESVQRFARIAQGNDSSVERLTLWRDTLGIVLADPARAAVGFGPETQAAVLERAEASVRLNQSQQWDRAHDLALDAWLTGGVMGLLALIVVFVSAIGVAWRARRASGRSERLLGAA